MYCVIDVHSGNTFLLVRCRVKADEAELKVVMRLLKQVLSAAGAQRSRL